MSDIPLYSIPEGGVQLSEFKLYAIKSDEKVKASYPTGFPNKTNVPHRHDFFEICIFYRGTGNHEIDFNKYPVNDYSIHFVTPGQVHLISNHEKAQGYILAFTEEFVELNRKLAGINIGELPQPYIDLKPDSFEFVKKILDEIMYEYSNLREESEEIIKSYLYIFILNVKSLYKTNHVGGYDFHNNRDATFKLFKEMVEKDYLKNQQVNYYADLLHISPSHLNKISKKVCTKTASDFIHDRVMLEAKRLLIFSDMSSKEIAYHLMYEDPSYFSRIFKKKTGYSPTDFRRVKLEKYQSQT